MLVNKWKPPPSVFYSSNRANPTFTGTYLRGISRRTSPWLQLDLVRIEDPPSPAVDFWAVPLAALGPGAVARRSVREISGASSKWERTHQWYLGSGFVFWTWGKNHPFHTRWYPVSFLFGLFVEEAQKYGLLVVVSLPRAL